MHFSWHDYYDMLKKTGVAWMEDKAPRLGAALAYYTIFSLAPLLVIVIYVASIFFGHKNASGGVEGQFQQLVGSAGAAAIHQLLDSNQDHPRTGIIATIIGIITLLIGASGVFGSLQDAMNTVWNVTPRPDRGWWGMARDRFLSFTMVLGICFLLLVSLVVSTALASVGKFVGGSLPALHYVWYLLNFIISFGVIMLLFAMIFKILPDVEVSYRQVWIGAAVTALLFTIGKWGLGLYLGHASVGSSYGAAGSLVVLLVWIYYSSQIMLFGAEFTKVYAAKMGQPVRPSANALPLTDDLRNREGEPTNAAVQAAAQGKPARGKPVVQPVKHRDPVHLPVVASRKHSDGRWSWTSAAAGIAAGVALAALQSRKSPARLGTKALRSAQIDRRLSVVQRRFDAAVNAMRHADRLRSM